MNHNAIGRGYETFGNGSAETMVRSLQPDEVSPEWYRVLPPPAEPFRWSARDNVNYNESGALAALDYTAGNAHALLRNFYEKSYHSWQQRNRLTAIRLRHPGGSGRSDARRTAPRAAAVAAHRGRPRPSPLT